jgi:uncharacterized repeat protein (TIGR01451 family)
MIRATLATIAIAYLAAAVPAAAEEIRLDATRLPGRKAKLADVAKPLIVADGVETTATIGRGRVRVQAFLRFNGKGQAYRQTPFVLSAGKGTASLTVDALAAGTPLELSLVHRGGPLSISIREGVLPPEAKTERLRLEAAAGTAAAKAANLDLADASEDDALGDDIVAELAADELLDASASTLPMVLIERLEVARVSGPLLVTAVTTDKIAYKPGETATLTVALKNIGSAEAKASLAIDLTEGLDGQTRVFNEEVAVAAAGDIVRSCKVPVGSAPWGRGIEAIVETADGSDRGTHAFSVVTDPWMAGFPGSGLPMFGSEEWTPEQAEKEAEKIAQANMANYANMYEAFAWAPCDYSKMTIGDDEPFHSGQTQYTKRRSTLETLHRVFHQYGIACITYGKSCGSGLPGVEYALKHPERMNVFAPAGFAHEVMSVDVLDRMLENRYRRHGRDEDFWQAWISSWTMIGNLDAANFGCDEIARSAKQFGWDGVRYDGHFGAWGNPAMSARFVRHCADRIQAQVPGFSIGYNYCGPQHGTAEGAFSDIELAACARDGGLIMSEYYRNILGPVAANINHLRWAGDATRLHGGYFLAISDDGTPWAKALMLAGGARPMGGGAHFGRFATRFSGFILDPAMQRLQDPGRFIKPGKNADFRWDAFVYEKPLSATESLLILQLVNVTDRFALGGVHQPPSNVSGPRRNVEFALALPDGYRATAVHAWDDTDGFRAMPATLADGRLTIPGVRVWTLAAVSLAKAPATPGLASQCEIPLAFKGKDATGNEAARAELKIGAAVGPEAVTAINAARMKITPAVLDAVLAQGEPEDNNPGAKADAAADFDNHRNGIDAAFQPAASQPLALRRNGRPDVLVVRGVFSHLDRLEEALAGVPGAVTHDAVLTNGGGASAAKLAANNPCCLEGWPDRDRLARMDVVVLDEIPAPALSLDQRRDLRDFVRGGGGLLVLGGWYSLSRGSWEGSFVEEVLPVEVVQATFLRRLKPEQQKLSATAAYAAALGPAPAFGDEAAVAWLNHVRPRAGAEILVTAGDLPALVGGTFGDGKVLVWAGSHSGEPKAAYWEASSWPAMLGAVVRRLAGGSDKVTPPDPAVAKRLAEAREQLDMQATDDLLGDEPASGAGKTDPRLTETIRTLLRDGTEADALAAVTYLLEHWGKLELTDFGEFTDAIVPRITSTAAWAALANRYKNEPPHGLGPLVAEIAAGSLKTIRFAEIQGWKIADPVTRLRCIAVAADPAALPALQAELEALNTKESRATENLYQTRLVRPFLAYAMIRCGRRDEETLYQLCRGVLDLPYYAWRQRWVLEGASESMVEARRSGNPAAVTTAKLRIRDAQTAIRALDRAMAHAAPLFRPDVVGTDALGARAAARALAEADCRRSLPLALAYLQAFPQERLSDFQPLASARLSGLRTAYRAATKKP